MLCVHLGKLKAGDTGVTPQSESTPRKRRGNDKGTKNASGWGRNVEYSCVNVFVRKEKKVKEKKE